MSGSGNAFVIIDNRPRVLHESRIAAFVAGVCRRRLSAGADQGSSDRGVGNRGLPLAVLHSDASPAEIRGNGARCAARLASGICGARLRFETVAGRVEARVRKGSGSG